MRHKNRVLRLNDNIEQIAKTTRKNINNNITNERQVMEALDTIRNISKEVKNLVNTERDIYE